MAKLAYDANGNTLTDASGKGYTWDFENRLVQAVVPGSNGGTTTFKYDPFGRRVQKSGPLGTTNYLYDGRNLIESVNVSGAEVASYTQTQKIDEVLSELRSSSTDYYQADGLGSVTSLSGSSGALTNTYTYDSFGNLTTSAGSVPNDFQYTGREFDPEMGIYEYRARYYDPTVGRFVSEDPIRFRGGFDFYEYARDNPIKLKDPTGLAPGQGGGRPLPLLPLGGGPGLPTVPTGKAGCRFVGELPATSRCKNCLYLCRGYGAHVVFPQAVGKQCPSIDPMSGLVNTQEIDPECGGPQNPPCDKKPVFVPLVPPIILEILEGLGVVLAF